jgi:hypothetical protein
MNAKHTPACECCGSKDTKVCGDIFPCYACKACGWTWDIPHVCHTPELLDLAKDALAQLEKMDFSLSANWNGSIKTNVALLLSHAIAKAEGRE